MKIGDEVFVHGYVDEIRKDVIIIRNDGGYFGTVAEEIGYCDDYEDLTDTPQTERKRCKLELFDDDGNYIEPQMEEGKFDSKRL